MMPKTNRHSDWEKRQQGVTLLLVAIIMFVVLAMAALAIDVSTLYVAHSEAQRAADAAAIAAARAFVFAGATSDVATGTLQSAAVTLANQQIAAALQANKIAGQAAQLAPAAAPATNPNFDYATKPRNPQITVKVQQTGLPTFFARIWRSGIISVSATATAEAFNPSGSSANPPVSAKCVKPFIVPNQDPDPAHAACTAGPCFIDPTTNDIKNPGAYSAGGVVGEQITFDEACDSGFPCTPTATGPNNLEFVPAILTTPASMPCPSCGGGGADFENNIACCNPTGMACNSATQVALGGTAPTADATNHKNEVKNGLRCLIHRQPGSGQDVLDTSSLPGFTGLPYHVQAGSNNALIPKINSGDVVMTSDSIITLLIYDGASITSPAVNIIGYMQVFVQQENGPGSFNGVILNIAGCGNTAGTNPIVGGGISPIPVRLIHQ